MDLPYVSVVRNEFPRPANSVQRNENCNESDATKKEKTYGPTTRVRIDAMQTMGHCLHFLSGIDFGAPQLIVSSLPSPSASSTQRNLEAEFNTWRSLMSLRGLHPAAIREEGKAVRMWPERLWKIATQWMLCQTRRECSLPVVKITYQIM